MKKANFKKLGAARFLYLNIIFLKENSFRNRGKISDARAPGCGCKIATGGARWGWVREATQVITLCKPNTCKGRRVKQGKTNKIGDCIKVNILAVRLYFFLIKFCKVIALGETGQSE